MLELFLTFFKIGLFTFGGGYAMLPVIENICVEQKGWITHDDMMNITVIAESTPGPIAINCATFVGYQKKKTLGAIMATLGVVLPSFLIIFVISAFLDRFLEISFVGNAFLGVKIAVGLLVIDVALKMLKKMEKNLFSWLVFFGSLVLMLLVNLFAWNFSTIALMGVVAVLSAVCFAIGRKGGKR